MARVIRENAVARFCGDHSEGMRYGFTIGISAGILTLAAALAMSSENNDPTEKYKMKKPETEHHQVYRP